MRVGGSAGGDEEVGALDYFLTTVGVFFEVNGDRLTGFARDLRDLCVQDDVDVFVGKKAMHGVADVFVLRRKEARIAADDGDVAAETAHGLSEFEADIAAAEDDKMSRNFVELEGFDVRERLRFDETGNWFECGVSARVHDYVFGAQLALRAVGKFDLDGLGADESPVAEDKFRAGGLVVLEVDVVPARYHFAFAFADGAHVCGETAVHADNAELAAAGEVRGDFCAVNDIFAGQAGGVGARAADVLAFDQGDAAAFGGKRPSGDGSPGTAAEDDDVEFFRVCDGVCLEVCFRAHLRSLFARNLTARIWMRPRKPSLHPFFHVCTSSI